MSPAKIILFFGLAFVECGQNSGPVGPMKFFEISECDPPLNKLDFKLKVTPGVDRVDKASVTMNLPQDYNGNDIMVSLEADRWENNAWNEKAFTMVKEPLVTMINKCYPRIFNSLKTRIQPPINDPSRLPKGQYKLDDFKASYLEMDMPACMYGRFLAHFHIYAGDEEVVCQNVEVEVSRPGL